MQAHKGIDMFFKTALQATHCTKMKGGRHLHRQGQDDGG